MRPTRRAIFVVGMVVVIMCGLLVSIQPLPLSKVTMYWEAEVGDVLQYDIQNWGIYNPLHESYLGVYLLNGTSVLATITYLPNLSQILTVPSFSNDLIHQIKVNCTFANGTELSGKPNVELPSMISGCILPVGAWTVVDSIYPDELPPYYPNTEFITTKLYEDYLTISYKWYGSIDDSGGWSGNVSLTTGIPYDIRWHYNHGGLIMGIQLSLVA